MIKYTLIENSIGSENESCYAIVSSMGTKNIEDIINLMIEEGSGLTRPQALAYFEKFTESVMQLASHGYSVSTPLFRLRPTISGVFNGKDDKFDPDRHQIRVRGSEGQRLREMPMQIKKVEKETVLQYSPILTTFTDINSNEKNGTVTPLGIGMLSGKKLGFDTKDLSLGLSFISLDNPTNKTKVTIYASVRPSEVHFQVPALQAGNYQLIIETLSRSGIRKLDGKLGTILTVH